MKKLLSILSAVVLTSTASTSIIACGGAGGNETPSVIKVELNTTTLKANLVFTETMTGQDAYNQLRTEIQKLSNGNYKDDKEIKNDNTLLISIWVNSTDTLSDSTTSNLSQVSKVDVKVEVTENNKAFNVMPLTTLSSILVVNNDLNAIISNKDLGNIYIGQKNLPIKSDILSSIINKNPSISFLNVNDFNFKSGSITQTSATIIGANNYTGEVNITYTCNNFIAMTGTSGAIKDLTVDKADNVYAVTSNNVFYKSNGTDPFTTAMTGTSGAIYSLRSDQNGNFYAAGFNGVFKSNGTDPFTPMTGTSRVIWALGIASDGTIYATGDNGVFKSNGTDPFTPMTGTSGQIINLTVDKSGTVYAAGNNGVFKSNGTDPFTPMTGTSAKIYGLTSDQNGTVYAAGNNGVFKSNGTDPFTPMTGTSGIIFSLTSDKNGFVYVGSESGNFFKSNGTDPFTPMIGLSGRIEHLTIASNQTIYAGGTNGTVFKSDPIII